MNGYLYFSKDWRSNPCTYDVREKRVSLKFPFTFNLYRYTEVGRAARGMRRSICLRFISPAVAGW
jgi:hypothetical protein